MDGLKEGDDLEAIDAEVISETTVAGTTVVADWQSAPKPGSRRADELAVRGLAARWCGGVRRGGVFRNFSPGPALCVLSLG